MTTIRLITPAPRTYRLSIRGEKGRQGDQGDPGDNAPTDHGLLTGLDDDDHPQYLTAARGDSRYYTEAEVGNLLSYKADAAAVSSALAGKADASHTHSIANVTGLQTALDAKSDAAATISALASKADASHTHTIANVTGLQTALDGKADGAATTSALAGKADTSHTHSIANVTGLQTALDAKADAAATTSALASKADASHTHTITNVTGLQTALDGKAASTHTHAQSDVTNLTSDLAAKRSKVDEGEFSLPTPTVSTIVLRSKSRLARTINGLYAVQTSAGTVTFTVKINGTAVNGLTNITATTTPQDLTATAANTVAVNDPVTLEITAVSGASGFRFTGQETLA